MMFDFTKLFDTNAYMGMQRYMDISQSISLSKQSIETWKRISNIWFDTITVCADKQMKVYQSTMEDSIDCVRDMSAAKGIEDLMGKQAEWGRKNAEKCQTAAQEIASTLQKSHAQCTEIASKMIVSSVDTGTSTTKTSASKQ